MTITKADIIKIIQKDTDLPKVDVIKFLIVLIDTIKETMQKGEVVYIDDFGIFFLRYRHRLYSSQGKQPFHYPVFIGPYYLLKPVYFDTMITYDEWEKQQL